MNRLVGKILTSGRRYSNGLSHIQNERRCGRRAAPLARLDLEAPLIKGKRNQAARLSYKE